MKFYEGLKNIGKGTLDILKFVGKHPLESVVIGSTLFGIGCMSENPKPCKSGYIPIMLDEFENHKGEKVKVQGFPLLIRKDDFVLQYEGSEIWIKRDIKGNGKDFNCVRDTLEKEARDGDHERIKVYGIANKNKELKARFVEIEERLYIIDGT